MADYRPNLAHFREVFTGGLTPGGMTAAEFDAALAEHDRQEREKAFDEAAQALAWAAEHGPDPIAYVLANNPHRSTEPIRIDTPEEET